MANVSHELKTPLSVVRMFADMLRSERVPSEERRLEYLDIICRESERLRLPDRQRFGLLCAGERPRELPTEPKGDRP